MELRCFSCSPVVSGRVVAGINRRPSRMHGTKKTPVTKHDYDRLFVITFLTQFALCRILFVTDFEVESDNRTESISVPRYDATDVDIATRLLTKPPIHLNIAK